LKYENGETIYSTIILRAVVNISRPDPAFREQDLTPRSGNTIVKIRIAVNKGKVLWILKATISVSFRISGSTGDHYGPLFLDLYSQNSLNPFLFQRITVSGFTKSIYLASLSIN
jgi:hypothetical protein